MTYNNSNIIYDNHMEKKREKKYTKKIRNLGLAGGGFFGFAHVAALKELEKYKNYIDIQHISGVSVGSMIAALFAVGYTADELREIIFKLDFEYLICDTGYCLTYYKLYEKFGMYESHKLEQEMERLICEKTHIKNCTFSQLDIDLTIISTNLNLQCPRIFNRQNSPLMVISKAVRMSISYPFIMTPVLFEGDLYGDGGEYINYPITVFDDLEETIGITFAAHNENPDGSLREKIQIKSIYDYIKSVGLTLNRATYTSQITPKYLDRSIIIHITENVNSMQFNLSTQQKQAIYDCGTVSVQQQIHKFID